MEPSPMGYFGWLPVELRMPIWADVLTHRSTAILRASSAIYDDIAGPLYETFHVTLSPDYNDPWLTLRSTGMKLTWVLQLRDGRKKRKKFWKLSYNKSKVIVDILAPQHTDPGQIILLWQKTQDLVRILNRAKYDRPHVIVRLKDHGRQGWQDGKKPIQSIEYPRKPRPNHLIMFLPFCRLTRCRKMEFHLVSQHCDRFANYRGFIRYGCDFIMNDGYRKYNYSKYNHDPRYVGITRIFDDIDGMITDTEFFLDTKLNQLQGRTAAMLRLDRFANWFTTDDPDISPYQRQLLLAVRKYPNIVKTHGPRFKSLNDKMRAFHALYHVVDKESIPEWVVVQHDYRSWYREFPHGIPIITWELILDERSKFFRTIPRHLLLERAPSDRDIFYDEFGHFLRVYRGGRKGRLRRRYLSRELSWCNDCKETGMTIGCEECEDCRLPIQYIEYTWQDRFGWNTETRAADLPPAGPEYDSELEF